MLWWMLLAGEGQASEPLLLKAAQVHTVSGAVIEDGAVLVWNLFVDEIFPNAAPPPA